MHLLLIQDQLRIGGTERQTLMLADQLHAGGHPTSLLLFRPGGHLAPLTLEKPYPVTVLQKFDSRISLWAPGLMAAIRQSPASHILCMGRTANCYAGFIQKKFPDRVVVGSLRTGKTLFPLHHWSMGVVRAVIVNSNWWQRRLLERNFPRDKIHVVHNALLLQRETSERNYLRETTRAAYQIPPDCCLFLNVATFRPGKRHRDLLQICANLRQQHPELNWRLWLVGDGKEFKSCQRMAARLGLGTRVRFFHFQHDPLPYYAAADIAVSASREDSLPNFLIEAQATGLPVIAFDCRGVNETCLQDKTGIILPPGDFTAFLNAMLNLAKNPPLRNQFAMAAPEFARRRFSQEAQMRNTLAFLQSIAPDNQNAK